MTWTVATDQQSYLSEFQNCHYLYGSFVLVGVLTKTLVAIMNIPMVS